VIDLRSSVKQTLQSIGFYRHRLATRPYPGVAILTYHGVRDDTWPAGTMRFEELHVTAARLSEQCQTLRDLDCTMLSASEWAGVADGTRPMPARAAMVSFDDGYRTVLTHALPVLERYAIPAIVFVCTGPVERRERFWPDALAHRDGDAAVADAKSLDHDSWRAMTATCAMDAAADDPHAPLSVDELRRLARHPLITIGAHTVSHPILRRAPVSVQAQEIGGGKETLEQWIGERVDTFAYPNGRPGADYDDHSIRLVRQAGFEHAFTTSERFAAPGEPPLEHPRFTMLQGISGSELAHRLAISWPRVCAVTA
jgi:peptidoglycan/xylan/chitin deacetylase (PgdA/CDA1 family)